MATIRVTVTVGDPTFREIVQELIDAIHRHLRIEVQRLVRDALTIWRRATPKGFGRAPRVGSGRDLVPGRGGQRPFQGLVSRQRLLRQSRIASEVPPLAAQTGRSSVAGSAH